MFLSVEYRLTGYYNSASLSAAAHSTAQRLHKSAGYQVAGTVRTVQVGLPVSALLEPLRIEL